MKATATAISALAARPGARLATAGLVLGAVVAAFGTGTARFEAGIDADLRALHGLERLDRLVDEAGAQLMRARVAPRRETDAGTRGAFHRLTALSFQAEQARGDLMAGVHGGALRAEMADMLSADRRLWDLLADESGLVREGAVAMASRLRGDSQRLALDLALAERKKVRDAYAARMQEASHDAADSARAWIGGGLAAIALFLAAAVRGARPRTSPQAASDQAASSRGAASHARPDTTDLTLAQAAARRLEDSTAATLAGLEARMARLAWLELQSAGHIARLGTPGPRPQPLDRAGARASLRALDIGLRDAIAQVETLIHMSNALDDLVVQRGGAVQGNADADADADADATDDVADMRAASITIAQEWNRTLALTSASAAAASRIAHQTLDRLEISAALMGRWIRLVDDAIALAELAGLSPLPPEAASLKPADAAILWPVLGRVRARLKRPVA